MGAHQLDATPATNARAKLQTTLEKDSTKLLLAGVLLAAGSITLLVIYFQTDTNSILEGPSGVQGRIALAIAASGLGCLAALVISASASAWTAEHTTREIAKELAHQYDAEWLGWWQGTTRAQQISAILLKDTGWLVTLSLSTHERSLTITTSAWPVPTQDEPRQERYGIRIPLQPAGPAHEETFPASEIGAARRIVNKTLEPYLSTEVGPTNATKARRYLHNRGYTPIHDTSSRDLKLRNPLHKTRWGKLLAIGPLTLLGIALVAPHIPNLVSGDAAAGLAGASEYVTADTPALVVETKSEPRRGGGDCMVTVEWTPPGSSEPQRKSFPNYEHYDSYCSPLWGAPPTQYPVQYPNWDPNLWTADPSALRGFNSPFYWLPVFGLIPSLVLIAAGGTLAAAVTHPQPKRELHAN